MTQFVVREREHLSICIYLQTAKFRRSNLMFAIRLTLCIGIRGVQIRSETDPIRSDFGTKIFISGWVDKVVS
jgi:hypothetical protein